MTIKNPLIVAAGGGTGKLYMHVIKFSNTLGLIKTSEGTILISSIILYIVCDSPVLLDSWRDYQDLIIKNQTNQFLYIPFNYFNSYSGSQDTIISSVSTYVYNGTYSKNLTTIVDYFKIGSTDKNLSSVTNSSYTNNYDKNGSYVIPLG